MDLPELEPYRVMKRSYDQHEKGLFIAEGEKVVAQLLGSSYRLINAMMPMKYFERLKPLLEARSEDFDIFIADKELLKELTGYKYYQGVLAVGRIPHRMTLEEAYEMSSAPRFFMAIDELANPENVGGIIRTAAAFGVQTILVGSYCCSPWLRRSIRSSVGNIFNLNVVDELPIKGAFRWLRERGMEVIAAHPHAENKVLGAYPWTRGDLCITVGNEGQGIPADVLAECSDCVAIPMSNRVDSLNVACAAATFVYDAWRVRTFPGMNAAK